MVKKHKASHSKKAKIMKRRRILTYFCLSVLILVGFLGLCSIYVKFKCKDLYYATEYYMTSSPLNKNKLRNVRSMNLVFSDNKTAVVEVKGIKPKPPNGTVAYRSQFSKTKSNSWKLDDAVEIEEEIKE